jgi:aerobic-type carbon monoxide dehydrogenase small subunit (CoxS/CutS family)
MLAVRARDAKIEVIEGIGLPKKFHPLQKMFIKEGTGQRGYCTRAIILTAKDLLGSRAHLNPKLDEHLVEFNVGALASPKWSRLSTPLLRVI